MKTSPRGIEDLILSEALKTTAYRDSGGVLTIGVGHTSAAGPPKVTAGMKITVAEAKAILARDLAKFEARVNKVFPKGLSQHAFDGAVSFDFNTGAIDSASWPTHYKAGRLDSAERTLKLWNKVKGKVVQGLVNRRANEADLIFRGKYRSKATTPPTPVPTLPTSPYLRKGDGISSQGAGIDAAIREAQTLLDEHGFPPGAIDGKFGPATERAVIAFQRARGLVVDGVIGPKTWAALRQIKPAFAVDMAPVDRDPDDDFNFPTNHKEDDMTTNPKGGDLTTVVVKSPFLSKINWTNVIAMLAMLGAMFGLDLDAQTQASIVAGIVAVQGVITVIFKTWFTNTVTPESAKE